MKYIQKILLVLVASVLTTGCIKDDYDDCDNVTICFQYLADGNEDVLYQYMKKVDLYVFDEDGRIMGVEHYDEEQLKNFAAKPSFRLTPGRKYKMAAVGNALERTEVVNIKSETEFNEMYIQHPAWGEDGKVDGHDHNYLGNLEFSVPDGEFKVNRYVLTLYSAHINVEVEVNGLPAPENLKDADVPYQLYIEGSNARTDLNGDVDPEQKGTCYPKLIYDNERKCYRTDNLCLFRMNDHGGHLDEECCEHVIVLKNKLTGEEIVRGSIYDYILQNDDKIDITKQEATLPIAINFSDVGVDITIPDWALVGGKPEWN